MLQNDSKIPTGNLRSGASLKISGAHHINGDDSTGNILTCAMRSSMSVKGALIGHPLRDRVRRMLFMRSLTSLCVGVERYW